MFSRGMFILGAVFVGVLTASVVASAADTSAYKVIVHPEQPANVLTRKFVTDAFLKRVSRWPDGEILYPVDLPANSPVRQRMVHELLGRSLAGVRSYWQQQIFSGRDVPPPELGNDQAVVRYVLQHRGAVGYVSAQAAIGAAKVVRVE